MPFHLIKGTFHVVGYSTDGDSIRFQADDRDNWELLDGPPVGLNARGHAQLRIEAIDTLETHYQDHHQPLQLANDALRFLLDELGIKKVKFDKSLFIISPTKIPKKCYNTEPINKFTHLICAKNTRVTSRRSSFIRSNRSLRRREKRPD